MNLEIAHMPASGTKHGTVVFLHGAGSWNWYWKPYFLPYFAAQGYDAVALSLRGHGKSEGRTRINEFTISDYVRDLRSVVTQYDHPLIVGHSMGGFVTQLYLTKYEARGAVLLAAAPPKPNYLTLAKVIVTQSVNLIKLSLSGVATGIGTDADVLRWQMFSRRADDRSMDQYLPNVQVESMKAISKLLTAPIKKAPQIKTPLLVLGAGRDQLIPPSSVATTGKIYGKKPVMFGEMSHMMMLEPGWQSVADHIIGFERGLT